MTLADEPARRPVSTALRRPTRRQSTLVRSGSQHAFDVYVKTIGTWWPARQFSAERDRVRGVAMEQRPGGRVYETWDDGTEIDWGTVVAWEPPRRFVMTWAATPAATEVELTFRGTRPGADPGGGRAPRMGGAHGGAADRGLRAARRLPLRRLLRWLGHDPGVPGQGDRPGLTSS